MQKSCESQLWYRVQCLNLMIIIIFKILSFWLWKESTWYSFSHKRYNIWACRLLKDITCGTWYIAYRIYEKVMWLIMEQKVPKISCLFLKDLSVFLYLACVPCLCQENYCRVECYHAHEFMQQPACLCGSVHLGSLECNSLDTFFVTGQKWGVVLRG